MFFKEPLTECFFVEPKWFFYESMSSLWRTFKHFILSVYEKISWSLNTKIKNLTKTEIKIPLNYVEIFNTI